MTNDPLVGQIIDGRYQIIAHIGEGGMGVVYKARQTSVDRIVAIKMLSPQMARDPNWVQRFYNEAKACSRLQHPNTIRMFDFGQTSEGRLFMAMEFLDGLSLRQVLEAGPMAPLRMLRVIIQCCASLAEAHAIGIIHRDIKPDNLILLTLAGSPDYVKLLDFSVAKLLQETGGNMRTQAGVVFGTPQYMSPEQGRGLPLDARSDLYALGILGFEMVTGRVPFDDDNAMSVIQMHMHAEVPPMPATVPAQVQGIIRKALEKDPARRYQSAGEMMQHAQQVFAELSQHSASDATRQAPGPLAPGMAPAAGHPYQAPMPGIVPALGMPPMQQAAPGGFGGASAQQKTMIAQAPSLPGYGHAPAPASSGQAPAPYGQAPLPGVGGYNTASPQQKTMMGGMALALPIALPPPQLVETNNRTMMLQPSDGLVSAAQAGRSIAAAQVHPSSRPVSSQATRTGATPLFWAVSLLTGIALGVGAYLAMIHFQ